MNKSEKFLLDLIGRALNRYANPKAQHNVIGGFPDGMLAWAVNSDLLEVMKKGTKEQREYLRKKWCDDEIDFSS